MLDNLLLLEPELAARLKAVLADLSPAVHVLSQDDLAGVKEEQQLVPAVHVVYQGYRVTEASRADGRAARIEQTWLAVVVTRNVANLKTADAARKQAGVLCAKVLAGLMGFKAASAAGPLKLATGPAGVFSKGFGYMPLAFTVELALTP
ncbi:MAG: hypothetical protein A2496_01625 [Burkholderiales bacterium RIFOXYC12_FULL_60_6]|nr:MAG: hypothetical protein A2503_10175 [Burkholderiales bacterium RIFOXYD12_FULL_59_19]OGB75988.1 MAG: hypothetical protein A2496_01625 [Burkholderiales bacterium RIFOXYC12_FULL_60_6]